MHHLASMSWYVKINSTMVNSYLRHIRATTQYDVTIYGCTPSHKYNRLNHCIQWSHDALVVGVFTEFPLLLSMKMKETKPYLGFQRKSILVTHAVTLIWISHMTMALMNIAITLLVIITKIVICHNPYFMFITNFYNTSPLCLRVFDSLWPSDAIWRQRSGSQLAQVMACCLTAPSHYLNQVWLMISEVLWHSPDRNFAENT